MSVDLSKLSQAELDAHHAKGLQLAAEVRTLQDEQKRLRAEAQNALKD
jgi:hypothetical protein